MNMNTYWQTVWDFSVCSDSYGYVSYRHLEVMSMKLLKRMLVLIWDTVLLSLAGSYTPLILKTILVLMVFELEGEGERPR